MPRGVRKSPFEKLRQELKDTQNSIEQYKHYRLQPEIDSMEPIILDHVEILGKEIGDFRTGIYN